MMNEAQRTTLQRLYKRLSSDLILTDDLIGNLYQMKIFEWTMIEIIKAEKTKTDQIQKLLELLPKRGPRAFDGFVEAIQNDYPWLASLLQSTYETERPHNNHKTLPKQDTARSLAFDTPSNVEDTKKKVGAFVHRQFGTSKRISQHDKKVLEKWLNEQLNDQRKRLESVIGVPESTADSDTESHDSDDSASVEIQQELYNLHCKIEAYLMKDRRYKSMQYLPRDLSFKIVSDELDTALKMTDSLQKQIDQSVNQFDVEERNKPLSDLVQSLIATCQQQRETLSKETKRHNDLLKELNEYSEHIEWVENERQINRQRTECFQKEVSQLRHQNYSLQEKCMVLEKAQIQHIEKEKTIQNLKMIVGELQACQKLHRSDVRSGVDGYTQKIHRSDVKSGVDGYTQHGRKVMRSSADRTNKNPVRSGYTFQMLNRKMASKTVSSRRSFQKPS